MVKAYQNVITLQFNSDVDIEHNRQHMRDAAVQLEEEVEMQDLRTFVSVAIGPEARDHEVVDVRKMIGEWEALNADRDDMIIERPDQERPMVCPNEVEVI